MKSNIKKYDCKLQTLTPIFIGSGYKYSFSEFIAPKAKLKNGESVRLLRRINFDMYYTSLSDDDKDNFLNSVSGYNFNLNDFVKNETNDKKIHNKFKRYDSINRTSNNFPNEVSEHIRTIDELFIPGSSLKGAIKTALFYDNVSREDFKEIMWMIKSRGNNKNFINKGAYSRFENNIFSTKKGKAAQFNISKFLHVSDSNSIKLGNIDEVITIKAKKNPWEGFEQHKIRGNNVSNFLETIPNKRLFRCKITTNFDEITYKRLNLNDKSHMINIKNIKNAIYNFSNDFINHELEFYGNYGDDGLVNFYKQLNKINSKEEPLTKIGSGSGFLQTTIGLKIKNEDPRLFEEIRKCGFRSYPYEYPKSRKIVKKTNYPLGWVKLKISEYGD